MLVFPAFPVFEPSLLVLGLPVCVCFAVVMFGCLTLVANLLSVLVSLASLHLSCSSSYHNSASRLPSPSPSVLSSCDLSSLCSSISAACTTHTWTAAFHAASVSLLSTASLRSATALLMLSGNGLAQDSAQYCSMRSNLASTCLTVSPLSHVDCVGSVDVPVCGRTGAGKLAVVDGSTITYSAIRAVRSCCLR
jgi:hypothetical protein